MNERGRRHRSSLAEMFIYSETKADGKSRIRTRRDPAVTERSAIRTITSVYVSSRKHRLHPRRKYACLAREIASEPR